MIYFYGKLESNLKFFLKKFKKNLNLPKTDVSKLESNQRPFACSNALPIKN